MAANNEQAQTQESYRIEHAMAETHRNSDTVVTPLQKKKNQRRVTFSPSMNEADGYPAEEVKRDIRDLVMVLRRLHAHYLQQVQDRQQDGDQQGGGGENKQLDGQGQQQGGDEEINDLDLRIKSTLKAMVNYFFLVVNRGQYLDGHLPMYCDADYLSDQLVADWARVKAKILDDASSALSRDNQEAFENCVRAVRSEDFEGGGATPD